MEPTATDAGPTPPTPIDELPIGAYASYVPHDLKYSADFEDSLVQALLEPNSTNEGIRVIPDESEEEAEAGRSIRAADLSQQSLPSIAEDELPLPLNDPRRIYASPVPGVRVSHPGGYLEGGPGLEPDMDTFPDDFLANNADVNTPEELRKAVVREIEASVQLLRERLRARQKAKEKNEQIEKELRTLMDQHSMELKIQRRMADEQRAKKEAREKRRLLKEGG